MQKMILWISGIALAIAGPRLDAADLVLVADGKPNAVIIVEAEGATPPVETPKSGSKKPAAKKVVPVLSNNQRAACAANVYRKDERRQTCRSSWRDNRSRESPRHKSWSAIPGPPRNWA